MTQDDTEEMRSTAFALLVDHPSTLTEIDLGFLAGFTLPTAERSPDTHGKLRSPSDSTFRRVINACEVRTFVRIVGQWMLEQEISAIARLALDGKTLRGSGRRDGKPLQIFSAVTHHLRLTLEQVPIEEKTNEIPNLVPLLKELDPPPGTLITADAMHCQ